MISDAKVSLAPQKPGVYMFLSNGKAIYIGRSKNLRERIRAYLEFKDRRESVPKIVEEADDVIWMITPTEEDAIFLEQKLIMENLPKYNVKVKDTRGLKYINIDMSSDFPSISISRMLKSGSVLRFGPFNARDARELLQAIKRVFNIRSCTGQKFKTFKKNGRACLEGQIQMCLAPCVKNVDRAEYMKRVHNASDFLRGRFSEVIKEIENKMWKEAEEENFELAAKYRDQLNIIKKLLDYKRVIFPDLRRVDYASAELIGDIVSVSVVKIREGRFFGNYGGIFRYGGQDIKDLISSVFVESSDVSECVSDYFEVQEKVGNFLFRPPNSPEEKEVLLFARKSAFEQALQSKEKEGKALRELEELSRLLALNDIPRRIEVFDFSNFGGKRLSGVKVHFEFGELVPSRLRLYNVSQTGYDDTFALRNVLERRLRDGISGKDVPLPNLILIDGGKGHYSVAKSVIESLNLPVSFACIKKEKRDTRNIALIYGNQEIKPKGKILEFILRLRDAAHIRAKKFAVKHSTKIK